MRILIVCNHLSIVGGAETYLQAVLPALVDSGHQLAILHDSPAIKSTELITEYLTNVPCWTVANIRNGNAWEQICSWQPDLVYCQGFNDLQVQLKIIEKWPTYLYAHGNFGTCISGTKRWIYPDFRICERVLGPKCLGCYLPMGCGGKNPFTGFKAYLKSRQQQLLLRKYKGIFVASSWMFDDYLRHGVLKDRLHLIPYFPPWILPDKEVPKIRSFNNQILFAGRVVQNKGWLHSLMSLKNASKALGRVLNLVVAGDGPDLAKMKNKAKEMDIKAKFLGWVDRLDMKRQMREADLLLMPSLWAEPFGLLGIEGGCVGLTTAGYRVGGIYDWLIPGITGESGSPGEMKVSGLTESIVRCLKSNEYWQKLRVGAWMKAKEFSKERHLTSLENIFHN